MSRNLINQVVGQVLWGANNIFQVSCQDGFEYQCRLQGKTLKQHGMEHNPLICGDFVLFRPGGENEGLIYSRIERRNTLQRRNLKRGEPQAFAANVDGVILLVSWAEPPLRPAFLDRLLVAAQRSGCPTLILLNKIDCLKTLGELRRLWQFLRQYRRLGLELWPISVQHLQFEPEQIRKRRLGFSGVQLGSLLAQAWVRCVYLCSTGARLKRLYRKFGGKLYVILGASGVGKSSLCNYFFPEQLQETRAISQKWQRGVHTTTLARILQQYWNGQCYRLIDTPGMRNFLPEISQNELSQLQNFYPEFFSLRKICSYSSCQHRNEPDCAVRDAADYGLISEKRYLSYLNLYNDLEGSFEEKPKYQTQGKGFGQKDERGACKGQLKERKPKHKREHKKLQLHCDEEGKIEASED